MIPLKTIISDIAKEATRVLDRDSHIFVHPNIPREKIAGAMSYVDHSVHPNEIVLLLDDTVFGGAKDGLALTETTLYVREKFCEPFQFNFAEISAIHVEHEFLSNVLYINNTRIAAFSQPSKDTCLALCMIMNVHCKQLQSNANTKQGQTAYGNAAQEYDDFTDPLRSFEICMITVDILTHFARFNGHEWRPEKLHVFNHKMFAAFQNQPYLYALLQQRIHNIESPALDQSIQFLLRHKPTEEARLGLMLQAFQILAMDESNLMDVEGLIKTFAMLLGISPSTFDEFRQELRKRFSYGSQSTNNNRHQNNNHQPSGNTEIVWACEILNIDQRSSTRDAVQQAYRNKIKEFHPDKHQSLPESVRQLIESKAQELNQARDILMAHFQ